MYYRFVLFYGKSKEENVFNFSSNPNPETSSPDYFTKEMEIIFFYKNKQLLFVYFASELKIGF